MSPGAPWRLILGPGAGQGPDADGGPPPADGARNMAVDHALLESVKAGGLPFVRLYRWSPATLSLGRNQRARGVLDEAAAERMGVAVVRRPTGGLAVLHDAEITYSLAAPARLLGSPRAAYHAINQGIETGLRSLGAAVGVVEEDAVSSYLREGASDGRCFREAHRGEIGSGGRKLVGSAQRREGGCLLQHGSILLDGGQERVPGLFGGGAAEAAPGSEVVTLRELLGALPPMERIVQALRAGFEGRLGIALAPGSLTHEEMDRCERLRGFYGSNEWTWRS